MVTVHQYCLAHASFAAGTFQVLTPAARVPEEVHPVPVIVSLSQILNAYRNVPPSGLRPWARNVGVSESINIPLRGKAFSSNGSSASNAARCCAGAAGVFDNGPVCVSASR
ncbi:hypothetical protein GCM10009525_27450 [Streptosporangium amethystogenes subsp. fukuiense]